MNLRKAKFRELLNRNGLTVPEFAGRLALPVHEIQWAADGRPISSQLAEILAEALGVQPKEIAKPESLTVEENFLEFFTGADQASVTFSQKRMISQIRRLAEKHPEECRIVAENKDRSIMAHIPASWIRVMPTRKLSQAQLEAVKKNLAKANGR